MTAEPLCPIIVKSCLSVTAPSDWGKTRCKYVDEQGKSMNCWVLFVVVHTPTPFITQALTAVGVIGEEKKKNTHNFEPSHGRRASASVPELLA